MGKNNGTQKRKKATMLIALNTAFVIFSLASAITGTYAWFNANNTVSTTAGSFSVANTDCEIESVTLYKFEYKTYVVGGVTYYDYISPALGSVNAYNFDFSRTQFGKTVQGVWKPVDAMNVYDPDAYRLSGNQLISLNCNAVYKVVFTSESFTSASLSVSALRIITEITGDDRILLSSCADFDIYLEKDVNPVISYPIPEHAADDTNDYRLYKMNGNRPVEVDGQLAPAWHPSYKSTGFTSEEELYYKISWLSSLSATHASFYGYSNPSVTKLPITGNSPINATFEGGRYTMYLNVNYSPSVLNDYELVNMEDRIRAVYDCNFSFYFE